jgi:hypothetical protein
MIPTARVTNPVTPQYNPTCAYLPTAADLLVVLLAAPVAVALEEEVAVEPLTCALRYVQLTPVLLLH